MSNRFRLSVAGIVLCYLLLAVLYSVVCPLFESSDEMWHMALVVHLARGGDLPVQVAGQETPWRQEGSQPPLYYLALAALSRAWALPLDDYEAVYVPNVHVVPGDPSVVSNRNLALHGESGSFPWQGARLTLHLWRGVSLLLGLSTVLAVIGAVRIFFPDRPCWAVGAGLFVALNPMFLFVSASVNNDVLVNAATAVGLAVLGWGWRRGFSWPWALALGGVLGVAVLSKLSGLALGILTAGALAWLFLKTRDWRWLAGGMVILVAALLVCGWWFWRNWRLYGDWLGLEAMLSVAGARTAAWATLLSEWQGFRYSFWGVFGGMNVVMPAAVYAALDALTVLSALGLLWAGLRGLLRRGTVDWPTWTLLLGYGGIVLVSVVRWTSMTMASQGRLMFTALGPIALGLWVGWETLSDGLRWPALRGIVRAVPVTLLAVLAVLAPWLWVAPAYRPPAPPTEEQIARSLRGGAATFGDEFRLLGHGPLPEMVQPGESVRLTLYFEALRSATRDWNLFVHLEDDLGFVIAQEDRHPQQGLVSARALAAGQRWQEVIELEVPVTALTPAPLQLTVGFYDLHGGERLPVDVGGGQTVDNWRLGTVALTALPGSVPNPVSFLFGEQIELVGFEIQPRQVRPGETVTLTLFWRATQPLERDYTVFTHILQPPQSIWGQEDRAPSPPTSQWQVGELYHEVYVLVVKPETPPGVYEVEIGLYRPDTFERLVLDGGADYLWIHRVQVR